MADDTDDAEKTEEASERKLRQAYEKGDVPKSQEVSTWFMILASTVIVATMAAPISQDIAATCAGSWPMQIKSRWMAARCAI